MIQNYFKTACRNITKNKTSSFINIAGLSVGLATGIVILLVTINELSYDRFNKNLNNTYLLMKTTNMNGDISTGRVTPGPLAASIRSEIPDVQYAARVSENGQVLVRSGDKSLFVNGIYAEPDFFKMMTFPALQGDPINALKEPGSAVITINAAEKIFGTTNVIGRLLMLDNLNTVKIASVIKDIPKNSTNQFDIILSFRLFEMQNNWLTKWDDNRIQTWIQTKQNANLASLNKKLAALFLRRQDEKNIELFAYPFKDLRLYGSFKNGKPNGGLIDVIILMGIIGAFVLLIACINFMNLATAQSERRAREVGVRKVLGASRKRIILQFLCEALLLSFVAFLLGFLIANLVLPFFMQITGNQFTPDLYNWRIWLCLSALVLFTGLVAGSYPALWLSRFQPVKVLTNKLSKSGGGLFRKCLVTFQFVISIFLIIAVIVIFKQINYIEDRPIGYNQQNLIDISARGDLRDKFGVVKNELIKIPGVKNVTAGTDNMIRFGGAFNGLDWPGKRPDQDFFITATQVQYDWIKTAGLTLVEGRDFNTAFGADSLACIINETAARKMGLQEPIVGTKLGANAVIGVVQDFVFNHPFSATEPLIIYLSKGSMNHFFVRIENDGNWKQRVARIEASVRKIEPNFSFDFAFVNDEYQKNFTEIRSAGQMADIFGGMAIFISCLGLFGLSAFLAERRSKEISIRKILGASVKSIWYSLSKDFLKPVFIALLIAIPSAVWLLQKMLQFMDYHIQLSLWMFIIAGVLVILIAFFTVSFNGIKAAVTNPAKNLRSE